MPRLFKAILAKYGKSGSSKWTARKGKTKNRRKAKKLSVLGPCGCTKTTNVGGALVRELTNPPPKPPVGLLLIGFY